MICIECGGVIFGEGELCEDCIDSGGMSNNLSLQSTVSSITVCAVCTGNVQSSNSRNCLNCTKVVHFSCDSTEAGVDGFMCISCRRSPLVGNADVVLTSANLSTSIKQEEIPSKDPFSSILDKFDTNDLQNPTTTTSGASDANTFRPLFQSQHSTIQQQPSITEEISDGATNDSARNSPFYENSDYDEDFVPSTTPTRGRGRGANNGGAKKKPGRGQSLLKKQSLPHTGFFSPAQLQAITQPSVRGKRGKRGSTTKVPGKGSGRGRGRGRAAANAAALQYPPMGSFMQQQQQQNFGSAYSSYQPASQPLAIREVDESMLEDESSRQSAATRADDAEYVRTIVVCNSTDPFLKKACLCLICGAVGKGPESSMVACSNCSQTYHTYCVGLHDKLNSTVIFRGWRCLDCTVCEGCGNGGDESKLLLCEECDVSYHIYCLKPPLERIPTGPWRCQWCSRCRRCNIKVASGTDLTRDGLCHPCHSLRRCPRCSKGYNIGDKIIRCSQCNKWQHGYCENLFTDEQLEHSANSRMRCSACRPNKNTNIGFGDGSNVVICDNVALSKCADEVLKSKFMPSLVRPSYESHGLRDSLDHYMDDDYNNPAEEVDNFVVSRGRGRGNPGGRRGSNRIGIGGFYYKLPRHRVLALTEEAAALNGLDDEDTKRMKRPRKPRRSQLEDAYPPAIQEAFFGIKAVEGKALVDISVEEPSLAEYGNGKIGQPVAIGHELSTEATEMLRNDINENEFLENVDLHEMDGDISNFDLSLFDDYDEDFEDSLGGLESDIKNEMDMDNNETKPFDEKPFGSSNPTSFPMDHQSSSSEQLHQQNQHHPSSKPLNPMYPNEANNYLPGYQQTSSGSQPQSVRNMSRSGSSNNPDAPERYQFSERWEEDEPLGLAATTAAVLYSNEKHGHLKEQYPEWTDRVKQIQRLWRTLSAEERQEYVNRARENRTSRGRNPRPRRNNAQTTSVDSPTVQSPAPNQIGRSDGFKVPAVPGTNSGAATPLYDPQQHQQHPIQQHPIVPEAGGMMMGMTSPNPLIPIKQCRITCHLTQEVHQQYQQIKSKQSDLEKIVDAMEGDLNKQRKQKKNLAAKKRQMMKTAQLAPDYDGRTIDLSDADKQILVQLTDSIKLLQGDLENSKREMKSHEGALKEFEVKNHILRNENEVTPQMIEQTQLMNQHAAAQQQDNARIHMMRQQQQQQQQQQMMMQQQQRAGVPPSCPPGLMIRSVQQQQQPPPSTLGPMRPGMGGGPPVPPTSAPPSHQSLPPPPLVQPTPTNGPMTMQQMQEMRKMHAMHQHQHQQQHHQMGPRLRSLIVGGVRYDQIKNQTEKEVYECMDDVLAHLAMVIDGHPPPRMIEVQHQQQQRDNHMLKRLLDTSGQQPGTSGATTGLPIEQQQQQQHQQQPVVVEGPKPKKKRTVQKKTAQASTSGGEYEAWVEKMRTRFRLCQEIPKKAKEPPLKCPGAAFAGFGISDIQVRSDRRILTGDGFGCMNLGYLDDYYTGDDRTSRTLSSKYLSMHDIAPNVNLVALYSQHAPSDDDYAYDDIDRRFIHSNPFQSLSLWLNMRRGTPLEHLRILSRSFEVPSPIEPLRRMFYAESKDEDIEVTVTFKCESDEAVKMEVDNEKTDGEEMVEQLKEILGISEKIEFKLEDTPPMSPSMSPKKEEGAASATATSAVSEKEIKMEVDDGADVSNSSTTTATTTTLKEIKREVTDQLFKCRHCSKTIETTVSCVRQKMGKLGVLSSDATDEEKEETAVFCSMKCYYELMSTSNVPLSHEELNAAESHVDEETLNRLKQIRSDNIVKAVNQGSKAKLPCPPLVSMEGLISPKDTRYMMDEGRKEYITMIHVSTLSKTESRVHEAPKVPTEEWKAYSLEMAESFQKLTKTHQEYVNSPKMGVQLPMYDLDQRQCVLCGGRGDGETSKCGRLLSLTEYVWVHVNCALWSSEVFENTTGGLMHVDRAVVRASKVACGLCHRPGASIKCHKLDCQYNFHVLCALQTQGYFIKDRTFICRRHDQVHQEVTVNRLDALRRIYIQRDENDLLTKMFELTDGPKLCLRLGAFSFYNVGQILPDQLKTFHTTNYIFPNGYRVVRWFWSPKGHKERMQFECLITDKENKPWFTVKSLEDETICHEGETATEAWKPIFDQVLHQRGAVDMLRFFGSHIQGETLFGLNENVISKITESLPGVDTLFTYTFRHANSPLLDLPLAENPMGCARAEPRFRTLIKHHRRTKPAANTPTKSTTGNGEQGGSSSWQKNGGSMTSSSSTSSTTIVSGTMGRTRGVRTNFADEQAAQQIKALGLSAEYAAMYLKGMEPIQGNQQIFSAYQKMRREWKNTVYLARSKIQGLGLYAKHDIAMGDFIIEYKGEIIRSEVGEVREKRYNAQNRGVYMFRIDEEWIIDATMAGGPARYINHSCDPNCTTRICNAGSTPAEKKIIITANRPIMANEELTYDYQFELEDSTDKIPCLCGAPNCVKWMN